MRNAAVVLSLALASSATLASTPRYTQAYGQTYAEVGNPGNADYTYKVYPGAPIRSIGGVDHRYRIAVTEVTNAQWAEFANAIAPFLDDVGGFTNDLVPTLSIGVPTPQRPFGVVPGSENYPARMGWRWAARYTNWLHNDKARTLEAFQSGAYDASTFGVMPNDGPGFPQFTDQSSRSEGARFWIPSQDEWVKAAYYDPNRDGEDQGGYWQHHGMRDDPLVTAPPDLGGETNAGGYWFEGDEGSDLVPFDAASYPDVASYYGVLDMSGGEEEWTETWISPGDTSERTIVGSEYLTEPRDVAGIDRIGGFVRYGAPNGSISGLRLAMVIPSPGSSSVVLGLLIASFRRNRQ